MQPVETTSNPPVRSAATSPVRVTGESSCSPASSVHGQIKLTDADRNTRKRRGPRRLFQMSAHLTSSPLRG